MALIKTNPIFFKGEEMDRREEIRRINRELPKEPKAPKVKREPKPIVIKQKFRKAKRTGEKQETIKQVPTPKFTERNKDADIIIIEVSKYFKLTPNQVIGKKRIREWVVARFTCYHLIRNYVDISLKCIGYHFSNADHSSVIHGIKEVQDYIDTDSKYVCQLNYLLMTVRNKLEARKEGAIEEVGDLFFQEEAYINYKL